MLSFCRLWSTAWIGLRVWLPACLVAVLVVGGGGGGVGGAPQAALAETGGDQASPDKADERRPAETHGAGRAPDEFEPASVTGDSAIDALIADLGDADYQRRERATQALKLMDSDQLSDEQIAAALSAVDVPEQAHRLRRVVLHRYYRALNPLDAPMDRGRGGLGVDLSEQNVERVVSPEQFPALENPAIILTSTVPGFPAYVHLKPGDMVVGIDGERFGPDLTIPQFRERLAGYTAGQRMTLHLVRDGEPVDVTLTLDNVARLDSVHRVYSSLRDPALYPRFIDYLTELSPEDRFDPILVRDGD